jgi:hypothetical protein
MLTAEQLDSFPDELITLFDSYQQSVLNDIARRLLKIDMTSTAAWQMQRLLNAGAVYNNALDELSRLTGKSEQELLRVFNKAGVKTLQFDNSIYTAAGFTPTKLQLSPQMLDVLKSGYNRTAGLMKNLVATTALSGQDAFLSAADLAYMQVSTGAFSYTDAIRQAVKSVAEQGLKVINYASGRKDQIDVAMRRAVLTGVSQTAAELQLRHAEDMGIDLIQTSAHIGARPTHQVWQGKIFSRSGADKRYPDFVSSTGYGTATGLCGINCRHSFYPFFPDISENVYKNLQEYEGKSVNYNGKKLTFYEATQEQRKIEREIRKAKRVVETLKNSDLDYSEEQKQVKLLQAKMRDFISQTGLVRQNVREQI